MTPMQFEIITILGFMVAIVSAVAAIAVVNNTYLKYGLLIIIICIIIVTILKLNSNNINNTSAISSTFDNTYKPKKENNNKLHVVPSVKKEAKIDNQEKNNIKEVPKDKEDVYRYKAIFDQNNYFIILKGCRRENDVIFCEIDIANSDKEHSIKLYNKDFPNGLATYIVDIKGEKYSPEKLNFTSAVEKVGWGRNAKYKLNPHFIIGLQFEYRNVDISVSKIKQLYISPEIFNKNDVSEGNLIIDIPNILIY